MNNKGFTLVELLAVMVILLAISVVAVTNVTASLKRNEDQKIETQKKGAINAAKIYFSMHDDVYCVERIDLIADKYLDDSDVDELASSFSISIDSDNYIYTENREC